jgi:predicted short-subunit dehydrogenase-like oxidoreductase (DUF2520 family)
MTIADSIEVTVIGMGALGRNLSRALFDNGFRIKSIYSRDTNKAATIAKEVGANFDGDLPIHKEEIGSIVFICVSDDAIEKIADQIASKGWILKNTVFAHCSGARPASALGVLKKKKAFIGSLHPLQTFTEEIDSRRFNNITVSVQGEDEAIPVLMDIARQLGSQPIEITERDKVMLHIAAVFTCNYLVTLNDVAASLLQDIDVEVNQESKLNMLLPLMKETLENIRKQGPEASLSGPLKRGDVKTIQTHMDALDLFPDIQKLYSHLGDYTIRKLYKKHYVSEDVYGDIHKMFWQQLKDLDG